LANRGRSGVQRCGNSSWTLAGCADALNAERLKHEVRRADETPLVAMLKPGNGKTSGLPTR